jgi:hypothetical protein
MLLFHVSVLCFAVLKSCGVRFVMSSAIGVAFSNPTPASYPKNLNRHQNFEATTTTMEAENFSSEKREFPKKKCGA